MRLNVAAASFATVLALSAVQVFAQEEGDPVTYTNGGVVYTAILDGDLDTVSPSAVSTVGGGALATPALITTTDVNGDTVTVSNGVTLAGGAAAAPVRTTSSTADQAVAGGVSDILDVAIDGLAVVEEMAAAALGSLSLHLPEVDVGLSGPSPSDLLHFQTIERRAPTPHPDPPHLQDLQRRQAALGGGGGAFTTQSGLQTISGYDPPGNTAVPDPTGFSSGSVLVPSQIPGYTGKENSQGVAGAGVRLHADALIVGGLVGAAIFALF